MDAKGPVDNAAAPPPREEVSSTSSAMAKTTTISTIAVQSGHTRIVIALLHYGDWISLKILEVTPELTTLGNTLAEALELQKAHDEVLRQLQNKQSPVEELLRQADQLIATQKPRAEVYAAMAESLGRAWKDINSNLEVRKRILDLNVLYHAKAGDFFGKMEALEASCKDTVVPIDMEAVKEFLTTIHEQRRAVLESLMAALQAGNSLLAELKELGAEGTLDSRPDRIRSSVKKAISQVQGWLDELHIKRQILEGTFNRRKTQLEQCLALAILAADLRELEDTVQNRRELLTNSNQYGDSSSSAELLLHEHKKLLPEAKQLQERALKITKATEQLVASGCFAGEQATAQSYVILSATSDYLTDLQNRESLLERVIAFFRSAQTVITKLDQLEIQLTATELPKTSPQLAQLHAQCARAIEDATSSPIAEGYAILDVAGPNTAGTEGVRLMVQKLENKKIALDGLCTAHKEENVRINAALNNFLERHDDIYTWLATIAEAFLQGHRDMGSDTAAAKDFYDLHNQLLTDLQTKGNEINALLLTLPPILEYLEDGQRKDIDVKVEQLHDRWMKLKNILENRMELARIYVKFHMEADIVNKEMDALDSLISENKDNVDDDVMKHIEEKFDSIVPLYQCAKNTGLTFINEAQSVSEPHLDAKRACACVDSVLERLSGRQLLVTRKWQTHRTDVLEKRELLVRLEHTMAESTKTINWVSKLDSQLYPVITTSSTKPNELADHIETRLSTALPDIRRAQSEVDQRVKTAETLIAKAPSDDQSHNVTNKLHDLYQRLSEISSEYQILLQVLIGYFRNLEEIDKKAENLNVELERSGYPRDISSIEAILRDHESSRQTIVERLRFAQTECDQIAERIKKQEPESAAEQDINKLQHVLELRRAEFENQWRQRHDSLESHRQLCIFDSDLHEINDSIDDLSRQVRNIKGQYGESVPSAKATSQTFGYVEKTIETLEQRINTFIRTGERLLDERHTHSPHIQSQISDLRDRWSNLKNQVKSTRSLLDLSVPYFELVEKADEWFREGSKLLVTIARKSTTVKRPEEAQALLDEISTFLKPGEEKQNERIRKITELATQLYGPDQTKHAPVLHGNKEMLDSFSSISKELSTLADNLRAAEEERLRAEREREEARLAEEIRRLEEARIAEEQRLAEQARRAEEVRLAEERRKAEEARIAEENRLAQERIRAGELRIAQERKRIEEARLAEEARIAEERRKAEQAKLAEESRLAEERRKLEEEKRKLEEARIAEELRRAEEARKAAEAKRLEEARLAEERRLAEEARRAEEARLAEERRKAEEARIAEETRLAQERIRIEELRITEEIRRIEMVRLADEAKLAEDRRKAEELKLAEEARLAEERRKLADERKKLEEAKLAEEARRVEEARMAEEARRLEEIRAEERRKAEEARLAEVKRRNDEARKLEEMRAEERKRAEEARLAEIKKKEDEVKRIRLEELARIEKQKEVEELREKQRLEKIRLDEMKRKEEEAERQRVEELARIEQQRKAEEARLAEEKQKAQQARLEEQKSQRKQSVEITEITDVQRIEVQTSSVKRVPSPIPIVEDAMEPPVFISPLSDAMIQEGSKFTFICQVVGHPQPMITWYKAGISIQNNPDYRTAVDKGLCSLTIEETFAEDSARYTCRAANAAGEDETTAHLSVKETEPEEILVAPSFTKHLQPAVLREGSTFQFECKVEGNPLPSVQWFKNADCIDNSPDYISTYNNGDAVLKFEKVYLEDKADYTCKAFNQSGVAQSTANLVVTPLEPTESPVFVSPLSNVMARAGQKIKLECEVSGLPLPNLTWSHNGKPVKETRETKLQHEGNKATLIVNEAFPKDAGVYSVIAKNIAGEAQSSCSVSVKGRLPTETSDSEIASDMEPIKPSIQLPLTNTTVPEGNRVRLDCVIVGQPEPEVIWYHDGRPVKESPDFQLLFQGDRCSLIIQEALPEDGGEYKVVALNSAGEASSQCVLSVEPSTEGDVKPKEEKTEPAGTAPKFTKLLSDVLISEGDKVTLEGIVVGEPKPEIKWLLNNFPITDTQHFVCSHDLEGNVKLEIQKARPEDKGVYTIKAANPLGEAKCFAQLIVKSFKPPETVKFEETKQAPEFKEVFHDRSAFEETTTKFECIVTGKPTPKVKWLFNGDAISGKDFLISTSGDRQVLCIPNLKKTHTGTVTCVAENEIGKASCAASLLVQSTSSITLPEFKATMLPPLQTSTHMPLVSPLTPLRTEKTSHVESSYMFNREVVTQTSTSQSSKIISSSSDSSEPHVEEHKVISENAQSIKQINQEAPEIKESHRIEEFHKVGKEPPVFQEKSSTTYTIGETQAKQNQITSSQQEIIHKPIVRTRPPKFVTPVIGKIVDQDVDVVLEGILDGSPTPKVSWTKNGEELVAGGKVEIKWELNRASVRIKNVRTDDAGRYSCTAVNDGGTAVSTADLVVRKTIFPPVFGRRLQAQVIKKGDRVNMEVEVTGTPEPAVSWFKDGLPVEDCLKNFKIKSMGQCHALIVDKADLDLTGRFMVRAVNSGGEAQSIADIAVFEPTPDTMVEVVKTVVFEDVRKHETLELIATPIITSHTSEQTYEHHEKQTKLDPFPFKPEPPKPKKAKCPPPPSPSKFVKGEFRESDYESDYEGRIPPVWHSDSEHAYKPVRPVLTPSQQHRQYGRTPTPPTEFDNPPQVEYPPRPKFEPIEKFKPEAKPLPKSVVYRPKPISGAAITKEVIVAKPSSDTIILQPGTPPEIAYAAGPKKTQYYRSTVSAPYTNAIQTETSNVVHFNESTESCHRTMSVQQTHKVIKFGDQHRKQEQKLEPFPYQPEPEKPRRATSVPPPPTPTKFQPGEFRESDYESEVENTRIKAKWSPRGEVDGLQYRRVSAPAANRSSSAPARKERVLTPMEFDTQPPQMPSQISTSDIVDGEINKHESTYRRFTDNRSNQLVKRSHSHEPVLHPGTPPEYRFATDQRITKSSATKIATHHMDSMTQAFKSKTQKFVTDLMEDVNKKKAVPKPILKNGTDGDAQVYREESRAAQYGTKHVDPDTGLIYFKYDFGYEFGIILPGESKQGGEIPVPKKTIIEPPKRTADIEMPVYHEKSVPGTNSAPHFKPKKFTAQNKGKWEPTSESEMSEYEGEAKKNNLHLSQGSGRKGAETPPSCPSTPGSTNGKSGLQQGQVRAPMFITPLRDIAVTSGQAAKFECIVQSEPQPNILWSKNGRIIENSHDYQLHYRNGVCRLTISQAYPEDAGTYSCTATNPAGTANTTATLQVPGERRSQYIK